VIGIDKRGTVWPLLAVVGAVMTAVIAACGGGLQRGAPLVGAGEIAVEARGMSRVLEPMRVLFSWDYVDERGTLRGEGAARANPPDLFRLDLFTTAEGSLAAALVDDELAYTGDLAGVELPPAAFLYAMAGVFRPGPGGRPTGFESDGLQVLEYPGESGGSRYFYLSDGRLTRVEERQGGRLTRRIELVWGTNPNWPQEASYRDDVEPRTRVRWELTEVVPQTEPYPDRVYELPPTP